MKRALILAIAAVFIMGSSIVCLAQMRNKPGREMNRPMMSGIHCMMGKQVIATTDGGVVVMSCNKLYKYDKDLNLIKEVEIPVDMKYMQEMWKKMKEQSVMDKPTE